MKLNQALAKAEHTGKQFTELLKEYTSTFDKKQGIFQGLKKTYEPLGDNPDEPTKKENRKVQSTVREYLDYFEKTCEEFVTHRFAIEATNGSGDCHAHLWVEGTDWGEYTSSELMRFSDFLNNQELMNVYKTLPVRSDTRNWKKSENEEYKTRDIWEGDVLASHDRTTLKRPYILVDPNVKDLKDSSRYVTPLVFEDIPLIKANETMQHFSGELSHRERAEILRRLTILKAACKEALVDANQAEVKKSTLTSKKIFTYLHHGK